MIDVGFDFSGRHVVVTGGTRGLGLAMADAFRAAGADVSVTGTKILPSLYDADLSPYAYHQLQLSSADAIDSFVDRVRDVDVLVNAAGARLPGALADHDREFLAHSARLGFVGPQRLTQQLRARLCASEVPSGGAVIHTSGTLAWYELTLDSGQAEVELRAQTAQAGRAWSRLGTRVNAVLSPVRPQVPVQQRARDVSGIEHSGALLVRPRLHQVTAKDVAPVALFLASAGAAGLSGQTLVADARR